MPELVIELEHAAQSVAEGRQHSGTLRAHMKKSIAVFLAAAGLAAAGGAALGQKKVERVYAAGPPASVLVFAIAPDKLVGWTRAFRPDEAQFVPERYAQLPELGRLTGRGNTANVEVVLKAKSELIVDVGSTGASLVSLAEQVQSQTGIPYLLFDGRIDATPATLRALGKLMGNADNAEKLAAWYEQELTEAPAARGTRRAPASRLLWARPVGPADRRQGIDQCRSAGIPRRAQRRRRCTRRARHRVARAGAGVESRGHHHDRSELLGLGASRSSLAQRERRLHEAHLPLAAPALRLVRLPARRQSPPRHLVGGQAPLPRSFRRRSAREGGAIPPALLSPRADAGAARSYSWRQ